ncbi:arylalkylamine N-acetyltransferase 1-like [Mya arenaria]|uniref:arylalkylamine N-acetyltransferase 1-like n=1 Tax=Mya arenaria TaxID=6604 RepID=UPI0022E938FB|nr:arylalkylamine N-acetyltransferase 1-like [Mya arenaria]
MAEKKGISSLTDASIEKAFQKTNEECRRPDTELVRLRENQYEDAFTIIKNWDEPLGKSLNLQWSKERESSWRRTFDEGLSLMLLDSNNGEAIGIRIIKQDVKNKEIDPSKIQNDALRKIHTFIHQEVEKSRFYEKYGVEESFHFLGLAVSEKYQKKGHGKYLLEVGVEFVKNLGICPYIHGEGSSAYSQKIYEKIGFETLKEVAFEDYKVNGEIVFKNTGVHKTFKVYGLHCI